MKSRGPFCHPGLVGASGAIWTPASVYPRISPFFTPLHPHFSVTGPSTLMSHGQSDADPGSPQLRGINSIFHFHTIFFLFSLLPPLQQHSTICIAVHLFSQSSLFVVEASQKQCENLAIDSCPLYYAATPSLSSLSPYGLFSGKIPAVSCDYRFAGLLLT